MLIYNKIPGCKYTQSNCSELKFKFVVDKLVEQKHNGRLLS